MSKQDLKKELFDVTRKFYKNEIRTMLCGIVGSIVFDTLEDDRYSELSDIDKDTIACDVVIDVVQDYWKEMQTYDGWF